jgi:hypothetical protein
MAPRPLNSSWPGLTRPPSPRTSVRAGDSSTLNLSALPRGLLGGPWVPPSPFGLRRTGKPGHDEYFCGTD